MQLTPILFLSTILFTTAAYSHESISCDDIAQDMSAFSKHKKSGETAEWHNITWLKKNIGAPEITKTRQKTYVWDKFLLSISNGKTTTMSMNTDPHNHQDQKLLALTYRSPTLSDVSDILGEPKKSKDIEILSYVWNCPNSKSNLAVKLITNKTSGNTKTNYSGRYCQEDACKVFHF